MTRDPLGLMTWKRFHKLDALLIILVHVGAGYALYRMGYTAYRIITANGLSWFSIWSMFKAGFGFSWSAWTMFWFTWIMALLGISVYAHRCKTHRALRCRSACFKKILAACEAVGFVQSVLIFCTNHHQHHACTDLPGDPHSPYEFGGGALGFWWAYILCTVFDTAPPPPGYRTPKYITEDPVLIWQNKYFPLLAVGLGFVFPFAVIGLLGMSSQGFLLAGWHGMPLLFLRLIFTWHPPFMVNSIGHRFGSRVVRDPSAREDAHFDVRKSRNFPSLSFGGGILGIAIGMIFGIFTGGENWHDNHHDKQRYAYIGWDWKEVDLGKYAIALFEKLHLVEDVVKPPRRRVSVPNAA